MISKVTIEDLSAVEIIVFFQPLIAIAAMLQDLDPRASLLGGMVRFEPTKMAAMHFGYLLSRVLCWVSDIFQKYHFEMGLSWYCLMVIVPLYRYLVWDAAQENVNKATPIE